jgi:lipid-A-disaccharide synthase
MSDPAQTPSSEKPAALRIFLVAAEESGDRLGAALMRALRQRAAAPIRFAGVGGGAAKSASHR